MRKFNLLKKSLGVVEKFIKETTDKIYNEGWGSGYVFLSPEHPYHGIYYDDLNNYIEVHGGLTFSDIIDTEMCEYWEISTKYIGWWCVGFDTTHFTITDWPKEEVERETEYLAQQFLKFTT
jgi:hypothetical protein